jgi:hypothetical protein
MKTEDFAASLNRLERLAKGTGQTQLFATPSDSNPGTWAGTSQEDVNEHEDGIDENGTDYNGVKKALASKVAKSQALTPAEVAIVKNTNPLTLIGNKIAKGQKLTAAEAWAVKKGFPFNKDEEEEEDEKEVSKASTKPSPAPASGTQSDSKKVPETNPGKDTTEEDLDGEGTDAKKSFANAVNTSTNLRKGIEMSPILFEVTRAIGEGLAGVEAGVVAKVNKSLAPVFNRIERLESALQGFASNQGEFSKSIAEAVAGIGQHIAGTSQAQIQEVSAPVSAPKSRLQVMQKSFGPGGLDMSTESLAKSQIVDVMCDLVKSNRLNPIDVVKYESNGEISPSTLALVQATVAGK